MAAIINPPRGLGAYEVYVTLQLLTSHNLAHRTLGNSGTQIGLVHYKEFLRVAEGAAGRGRRKEQRQLSAQGIKKKDEERTPELKG